MDLREALEIARTRERDKFYWFDCFVSFTGDADVGNIQEGERWFVRARTAEDARTMLQANTDRIMTAAMVKRTPECFVPDPEKCRILFEGEVTE